MQFSRGVPYKPVEIKGVKPHAHLRMQTNATTQILTPCGLYRTEILLDGLGQFQVMSAHDPSDSVARKRLTLALGLVMRHDATHGSTTVHRV